MGALSDSNHDDATKEPKSDVIKAALEGYTCHRLQLPAQAKEALSMGPKPLSFASGNSLELYNVVREACAQQNVKWPVECQVVPEPVQHIEDWPLYPESFYQPSGRELRPQPVGDEMGRVVYQYYPTSTVNYFSRSCLGGNKQLSSDVRPPLLSPDDTTLQFESRFESGNLAKSVQISECYYELHIRADLYTARHTQWFYFSVSNTRKDITYRLSIVNLCKGDSLYNHGMRPLLYSSKEAELHNIGWRRCASNIVYFRNQDCEGGCFDSDEEGDEETPSFTLTFNITFPHDCDTVYIAHCFPYTYSMLQQHLLSIQNDPYRSSICRQRVLCRSLAGNPVYLLTITGQEPEDEHKRKRAVVLSARVHPGETPASWILKGVLDFLTSDHTKAIELRRQFVFKVIPMVNPDGVIVGNHRCSLAGRDLNRQYKMVVKEMFPAVWHAKAMVRKLMDEHGVVMYCDFHAHSRRHNIFLYGCENRRSHENHLREQIFPLLLHYNAGDKFSFRNCKFRVHRCKEGTARVVVWMMGILHSYTLESSFGGTSEGPRAGTHYSIYDFLTMGKQFCESLAEYFDPQPVKEKLRNRLWTRLVKKGSNADEPTTVDLSDTNSSSGDSDHPPPPRARRKRLTKSQKKKTTKPEKPIRANSMESQDDADGAALLGNVSELLSHRLSLSDNEVNGSPSFWELRSPTSQWEAMGLHHSTSNLSSLGYHRCQLTPNSGRLEALEPVIAKTRLHEPRLTTRSPQSRSHKSLNVAGRGGNASLRGRSTSERSGSLSSLKPRQKLQRLLLDKDFDSEIKPRSSSVCLEFEDSRQDWSKEFDPRKKKITNNLNVISKDYFHGSSIYDIHRTESSGSFEDTQFSRNSDPAKFSLVLKDTKRDNFPLLTKPTNCIVDDNLCDSSWSRSVKKNTNQNIDEDQLCADIANCDTLFLDTGLQETPQLKAARNLKGKVKKKKISLNANVTAEESKNQNMSEETSQDGGGNEDKKDLNNGEILQPEIKVRKKIKIVIGKKTKTKTNKKKSLCLN